MMKMFSFWKQKRARKWDCAVAATATSVNGSSNLMHDAPSQNDMQASDYMFRREGGDGTSVDGEWLQPRPACRSVQSASDGISSLQEMRPAHSSSVAFLQYVPKPPNASPKYSTPTGKNSMDLLVSQQYTPQNAILSIGTLGRSEPLDKMAAPSSREPLREVIVHVPGCRYPNDKVQVEVLKFPCLDPTKSTVLSSNSTLDDVPALQERINCHRQFDYHPGAQAIKTAAGHNELKESMVEGLLLNASLDLVGYSNLQELRKNQHKIDEPQVAITRHADHKIKGMTTSQVTSTAASSTPGRAMEALGMTGSSPSADVVKKSGNKICEKARKTAAVADQTKQQNNDDEEEDSNMIAQKNRLKTLASTCKHHVDLKRSIAAVKPKCYLTKHLLKRLKLGHCRQMQIGPPDTSYQCKFHKVLRILGLKHIISKPRDLKLFKDELEEVHVNFQNKSKELDYIPAEKDDEISSNTNNSKNHCVAAESALFFANNRTTSSANNENWISTDDEYVVLELDRNEQQV